MHAYLGLGLHRVFKPIKQHVEELLDIHLLAHSNGMSFVRVHVAERPRVIHHFLALLQRCGECLSFPNFNSSDSKKNTSP